MRVLAVVPLVLVLACAGPSEEVGGSQSTPGTSTVPEGTPEKMEGAVVVRFTGDSCKYPIEVTLGDAAPTATSIGGLWHSEDGGRWVVCQVEPKGDGYTIEGSLQMDPNVQMDFVVEAPEVNLGVLNTADIVISDVPLRLMKGVGCTLAPITISAGMILSSFHCDNSKYLDNYTILLDCALDGYISLRNCVS
jgi:hypothetical protein